MPAARAASTSFTESPTIKDSDGGTCSDSHAKNNGCGSGLRRAQVSPPTTTSTQASRPSRLSSAPAKRCCLLVTTAVRSPASCKVRSDSAAPAYGRALNQIRRAASDHAPHLVLDQRLAAVLDHRPIECQRDVGHGIKQRAVEIEQYRRKALPAPLRALGVMHRA